MNWLISIIILVFSLQGFSTSTKAASTAIDEHQDIYLKWFGVNQSEVKRVFDDFKHAVKNKDPENVISHFNLDPDYGYSGPTPKLSPTHPW